ncbi:MAG: Hpt domain-containing protein [SAR324 cluster bacterium]|nr:Hpt domain-containing protein [SAR324 cluster bacterium]
MSDKIIVEVDEDLESLMDSYLAKRLEDIQTITDLSAEEEFSKIQALAHKMKGSGGGYGLDFISEVGLNLEVYAKSSQPEPIFEWLAKLKDFLERLEVHYVEEDE